MAQPQKDDYKTEIITNFSGRLTRLINGELNSGFAKYSTTHSIDPFSQPQNLHFMENALQIDAAGSVITDLIVAAKERVEGDSNSYIYAIGNTGRLYKIQSNNVSTNNPNYNNPVLLTTLTSNSPAFTQGGSLTFYGNSSNQYIYVGSDQGVTRVNFDGTGEAFVGTISSTQWIAGVPRQVVQFQGSLYYTNNNNIAQIDSTLAVVSYGVFAVPLPVNTIARDIRFTADGTYIVIVSSEVPLPSILLTTPDTYDTTSSSSTLYYWNGSDTAYTSSTYQESFTQTAYFTFQGNEFCFGYDVTGANVSSPTVKLLSMTSMKSPLPNAIDSNGNLISWTIPGYDQGFYKMFLNIYGSLDNEVPVGLWRQYKMAATSPQTDILQVPFQLIVNSFLLGNSTSGYSNNLVSIAKQYFSTLEYDGSTVKYRFYVFYNVPVGVGTAASGVYETQTQLFGMKRQIKEVRVYVEPLVTNNSFQVDLIGSGNSVISGSTRIFTVGGATSGTTVGVTSGTDMVQYNPNMPPTYALGLRITNLGTANWYGHKVEIDHCLGGRQ